MSEENKFLKWFDDIKTIANVFAISCPPLYIAINTEWFINSLTGLHSFFLPLIKALVLSIGIPSIMISGKNVLDSIKNKSIGNS